MQRRNRPTARVVVVDEIGRVLLLHVDDRLSEGPPFWITPGGGLDADERYVDAAVRELKEETGLEVSPEELGEPIAVSRGNWDFRGRPFYSESLHFGIVTPAFELDDSGWDEIERSFHTGWRWWTPEELEETLERIIPKGLASLARKLHSGEWPDAPIELPWSGA